MADRPADAIVRDRLFPPSNFFVERGGQIRSTMPTGFTRSGRRFRFPSGNFTRRTRPRLANGASFSRTMRRRRRGVRSGQGVTDHFDRRLVYRHKRMPGFKRRRWTGFLKKVRAANISQLGSRTIVFNNYTFSEIDFKASAANLNKQLIGYCCLYGVDSGAGASGDGYLGSKDLQTINNYATSINTAADIMFTSAVLDVTFVNRNYNIDSTGPEVISNWDERLELDVYEIIMRKDAAYETNPLGLLGVFSQAVSYTGVFGAGTAITGLDQRGCTPWDIPQAMAQWGIRILKKTKFTLARGQTCTYQVRDPKNRLLAKNIMDDLLGVNLRGWTRYVLYIAKPVAGFDLAPAYNTAAVSTLGNLTVGATRKYTVKILSDSTRQSSLTTL